MTATFAATLVENVTNPNAAELRSELERITSNAANCRAIVEFVRSGPSGNPPLDAYATIAINLAIAVSLAEDRDRLTAALDRVTEELAEARARAEQVAL